MKQDHLLSEGRQMPHGHQQQLLHLSTRITYFLKAGKCHMAISNSSCINQPGSLTDWGQAMPPGHQHQLLHLSMGITYILRAGKCHKAISNSSSIYQMGSLTCWGQENATRPSAIALVSINQDHLHPENRQMPPGHQHQLLHQSTRITYCLRAGNATRPLVTALAPINGDHLHPEGRQMPQGHQQQLLHLWIRITHSLTGGKCHKAISNSSCTHQPGSLTNWGQVNATRPSAIAVAATKQDPLHTEGRQMPQGHQQQLLHLSSRITYWLKMGKYDKTVSDSSCTN